MTTKLVSFFLLSLCFTFGVSHVREQGVSEGPATWDTLILTQFWPPAACLLFEHEDRKCDISRIKSWVIHGLWPTQSGTEGPNFCNKSCPFDPAKVQALEPKLRQNWPAIEDENPQSLWAHEWDKHGTCGTSLPALKDEYHYFNTTLTLHYHFDLSMFLKKGNIIPSEDTAYDGTEVLKSLSQNIGSVPFFTCVKGKDDGRCYLEQIELCLSKSFKPVDCKHASRQLARHDLLFLSETAMQEKNDRFCDCASEKIYYKPMPSV